MITWPHIVNSRSDSKELVEEFQISLCNSAKKSDASLSTPTGSTSSLTVSTEEKKPIYTGPKFGT